MTVRDGSRPSSWRSAAAWLSSLLVFGAIAAMVSGLLQTLSLTLTNPVPVDGSHFGFIGMPPVDFADRLSVFTSAATDLPAVLMLVGAALGTSVREPGTWHRFTVVVLELLVAIVIAADLVMAVEVGISHGPLFFPGVDATTRATGIVGLLAPAVVAAAAGVFAWTARPPARGRGHT